MAKVYIGVGHGGSDSGAVRYLVEKDVNLKMALACCNYLQAAGVDVKTSRTTDKDSSIIEKVNAANIWGADLALDIHNNAGGGDGAEVYHSIVGGTGKRLADNILSEFEKIGQNVRGAKTKQENGTDYFGFIRLTDMPAVITEAVFVDNAADAAQADTDIECVQFGEAIAKGILKTLGIADKVVRPSTPSKPAQTIYRVQVGAYTNRSNAVKLAKKLNSIGYKTLIVKGGK